MVQGTDAFELKSMKQGFTFFREWCKETIGDGRDPDSTTHKSFLSWQVLSVHSSVNNNSNMKYYFSVQTWDLLRIMYHGFTGLCTDFLLRHPGYFISPVRLNGSAVEPYFSQLKYAARRQLSSVSYQTARVAVETSKAVSTKCPHECDYRDAEIDIHPVQLKKKKLTLITRYRGIQDTV